jgi:hypothetical protein
MEEDSMARTTRPLSNNEILKAKAKERDYSLFDGGGLLLLVKTTGIKLWRFRYSIPSTSNRTTLSLGPYPALSLADARQIRDENIALLVRGIDPQKKQEQQKEEKQIAEDSIFLNVALKWFALKERKITQGTAQDVWRSIEKDILPTIGNTPIQELKARTLIQMLEPVKARGALKTVRRLVQRINEIMIFAVNTGLLNANPASGIRYAFEQPKKQHMPTIRPKELPQLMRKIAMSNLFSPYPLPARMAAAYPDTSCRSVFNSLGRDRF